MQTQGFTLHTLTGVASQICPMVPALRGQPDPEYFLAELNVATHPGYESLIALSKSMLKHDRAEACQQAQAAMKIDPNRFEADLCLAQAALKARVYSEACRHYSDAERKGCQDCFADHAHAANKAGTPHIVLELCQQAGVATSDRLRLEKARALRLLRRVPEALAELNQIPSAGPEVIAELGECYLAQELFKLAAEITSQCAQTGQLDCLRVYGLSQAHLGHHQEATQALQRLVRNDPNQTTELWYLLSLAALLSGFDQLALEASEHVLSGRPGDRNAQVIQAQALIRLRRYQEALNLCYRNSSRSLLPQPYLVFMLIELGEMQEALNYLREWLGSFDEAHPPDMMYWLLSAYCYERLGRFQEALQYYENARAANPQHPEIRRRYEVLSHALENDLLPEAESVPNPGNNVNAFNEVTALH
jgi:tetratricopeptide (TPR) repeat protein